MAFKIKKATRTNAKLVIGFVGQSGDGKTLSALLLALGMAKGSGNGRVGFLDTENGRSSLYADEELVKAEGGFDTIQLDAPFSPERFIEGIESFVEADYPVIVIDSITHEWNNAGGILELVDNSSLKNDLAKWATPKKRHNNFFQKLLQADAHIILCFRAKEKQKQVKDEGTGKMVVVSKGIQPIQNAEMIFDMTISFRMEQTMPKHIKMPSMLQGLFPQDQRITVEHGRQLADWVKGGDPLNPHYERLKISCREAAEGGIEALKRWFTSQSESDRLLISAYKDECKSIAVGADLENAPIASKGNDLTQEILGGGADLPE